MRLTMGMKKVFSLVLVGAMVLTGANVNMTKASAEETTAAVAVIGTDANGWAEAPEVVKPEIDTTATEAKTYTISATYTDPVSVENYLGVRIESLDSVSTTVKFSNVKVWLDGHGIEVAPNTGGDGDCRIEIANTWGKTPLPAALSGKTFNKIEIEFTVEFVAEGTIDTKSNTEISTGEVADKTDAAPVAAVATCANGWVIGDDDKQVTAAIDTTATEAKTYTVSNTYAADVQVENYLAVRIEGLDTVSSTVEFSDVSVWLNGHAVPVTPNYGGDGDCRIEIVNNWGSTPINDSFNGVLFNKVEIQFTLKFVPEGTTDTKNNVAITTVLAEDKTDATPLPGTGSDDNGNDDTPSVDENNVWSQEGSHAYISYQMAGTWDYRNTYEAGKTAKDSTSYQYIKASGEEVDYTSENIKDALLTADGEYTISLTGLDLSGSDKFNWLTIATDIERAEYPDVKVTNATVKIDGNVVEGLEAVALPYKSAADDKYYVFEIASTYTDWVLSGEATKYYRSDSLEITPEKSVEVTFTISGLGNQVPNEPIGLKAGKKFTAGNFVYQVTKQAMTRTNGAVKVVGLSKKAKKAKSLTVANTAKNKKAVYNVTAIDKNAFKGASATAVTLGKKIKSIPASAFANCKKLTTLTLKAKLKSVDKNAFKGCAKTITVKGTAKKANVKLLKKSGYKNFK